MGRQGDKIAVIDCETDPFDGETFVLPFVWGFFDGIKYIQFDGPECTYNLVEYIKNFKGIVYAHNGGKFDFHFLLDYLDLQENMLIINGRIAKAKLGKAILQDSYCILPVPLSAMEKDEFDYSLMKEDKRIIAENYNLISTYLQHDCEFLYSKVRRFIDEYGYSITLAGAAFKQFKTIYNNIPIPKTDKKYYADFKPFYYGGRVSVFKSGVIKGDYEVIDINSAYPFAMLSEHPFGAKYITTSKPKKFQIPSSFLQIKCFSKGALPVRTKTGVDFPTGKGEFFVTGWEYLAGIDTGTIKDCRIIKAYVFNETINFKLYVDKFYALKDHCGANGDKIGRLYAKLFLNTLYGKWAANPQKYKEYYLDYFGEHPKDGFNSGAVLGDYQLYSSPLDESKFHFYNIATAASITGFVRAYLWRAINLSKDVIYCDTDSEICKGHGDNVIGSGIGEWDVEAKLDKIAIAGKKMYACWKDGVEVKHACKGVDITPSEIESVANGDTISYKSKAPTYSISSPPKFLERKIKPTF